MANESGAETDLVGEVGKAAGVLKTVMEIAEKTPELKAAGTNVAKVAQTVTALVNNCLLPIAAVNYAFDRGRAYFETKFQADVEAVTAGIPLECIVEPKASIVAPILQGLTFAHEEEVLKAMFLHLLKSSMDARTQQLAHPAFVEVIKQIGAYEASILKLYLSKNQLFSIAEIRLMVAGTSNFSLLQTHILGLSDANSSLPQIVEGSSAMVDNWIRLGLIVVDYGQHIADENAYKWVENRPEYISSVENNGKENVAIQKGVFRRTSFGSQFWSAVG